MKQRYEEFRKEPIRENCIVFESLWGRSYSCNPAALYEYIMENHPEYECVWFFNDTDIPIKGNAKKVERKTEEFYHYLATAKYFITNTNMPLSFKKRDGQIIVQTMHGTPLKTFGLDVKEEFDSEKDKLRVISRGLLWDYLIVQGRFAKDMAWRWFRYNNAVLETGYPRTDAIYNPDAGAALKAGLGIPAEKRVLLYAPTWRDMDRFDMMLDLDAMRRELANEYAILIRPHYFVADKYEVPEDGKFIFDGAKVAKIEDLFPVTDILITDYSSVMFDFALTQKPMIFFAYDLEDYANDTRGVYFDITAEAPGAVVRTTAELIEVVRNTDKYNKLYADRISSFFSKYLTYEHNRSSAAVYKAVFEDCFATTNRPLRYKLQAAGRKILPEKIYGKLKRRYIKRLLNAKIE